MVGRCAGLSRVPTPLPSTHQGAGSVWGSLTNTLPTPTGVLAPLATVPTLDALKQLLLGGLQHFSLLFSAAFLPAVRWSTVVRAGAQVCGL